MTDIEIFFEEDSDWSELESANKGYRLDVYVKIRQNTYHMSVYTIVRLQQDFETEMTEEGFYLPDPNIVLVENSNKLEIISTINWLVELGYFTHLKCSDKVNISALVKVQ